MQGNVGFCGACGGDDLDPPLRLRELMYATGESFEYVRCRGCHCLQIVEPPADMAPYYAENYYSFDSSFRSRREWLRDWLTNKGPSWAFGHLAWYRRGQWRSIDGISREARIVDIGCGDGGFISRLRDFGYVNVCGIDAFIDADRVLPNGVPVFHKSIEELDGEFDVVMMHYSLEHMPSQLGVVEKARDLLGEGGRLIVRIPAIDSWAADEFGPNWAHLDPPRHFFLHTRKSIATLVERAGLTLDCIVDDWHEFGVHGSLLARSGKPSITGVTKAGAELGAARAAHRRAYSEGRSDTIIVHAHR